VSDSSLPRYCRSRPLPPYSYVPGLAPHPTSDPRGHSFGLNEPSPPPLTQFAFRDNASYLYGIDLFNHGYYWEAHEAWESLWHAAGRSGPTADFLKGLIKLAAAGVKLREGRPAGVRQHAQRAAELFRGVGGSAIDGDGLIFGLQLEDLDFAAAEIVRRASEMTAAEGGDANRNLGLVLRLADRNVCPT